MLQALIGAAPGCGVQVGAARGRIPLAALELAAELNESIAHIRLLAAYAENERVRRGLAHFSEQEQSQPRSPWWPPLRLEVDERGDVRPELLGVDEETVASRAASHALVEVVAHRGGRGSLRDKLAPLGRKIRPGGLRRAQPLRACVSNACFSWSCARRLSSS